MLLAELQGGPMDSKENQQTDLRSWELSLINEKLLPYLRRLGYEHIEGNVSVPLGSRTLEADCVVYLDEKKEKPFIVVEAKSVLRPEVTLMEPAVQQAFAVATALGGGVRYILVTDGSRYQWFERGAGTQSLAPTKYPPKGPNEPHQRTLLELPLTPVAGVGQYLSLLESVVDVLRKEGFVFGLRMGIELNRILIAKLHDERVVAAGGGRRFSAEDNNPAATAARVKELYGEAMAALGGEGEYQNWSLSAGTLFTVVRLLEPYAISSVTDDIRDRSFWRVFSRLLGKDEGVHTTPSPLAELLIHLADPAQGELVIDPACGTGLLLLEAYDHINTRPDGESENAGRRATQEARLTGIELNAEVAELAATNFALNGFPPARIINADSLRKQELERAGVREEGYDLVLLHPPLGHVPKSGALLQEFKIVRDSPRATLELLFIELSLRLLRRGGRLAAFVPDTFLSSPSLADAREWLLGNATPKAIISLPPEAFMPAGHSGKASVLVLEKRRPYDSFEPVLVADIRAVGYDRFGEPTRENDLPRLLEVVRQFRDEGHIEPPGGTLRAWIVEASALEAERLDITSLDPEGHEIVRAVSRGQYPAVKLGQVAEVISGRNFKTYVDPGTDSAILVQAGAVKELEIDFAETAPHISLSDYEAAKRAQLSVGDVLVTSTGQYLGRAAVVERLAGPAVASGAVTVLRPREQILPHFLAAVINSVIGREQINRLQAAATAQPYIRRADLSEVIIPLPPPVEQESVAAQIQERLNHAKDLRRQAQALEEDAKSLVEIKFLGGRNR
jgi:type I restriction enzyme M protein